MPPTFAGWSLLSPEARNRESARSFGVGPSGRSTPALSAPRAEQLRILMDPAKLHDCDLLQRTGVDCVKEAIRGHWTDVDDPMADTTFLSIGRNYSFTQTIERPPRLLRA
jgi:hypothetical protein